MPGLALIIGEDLCLGDALGEALRERGMGVALAGNGEEALEMLEHLPAPNLVVVDVAEDAAEAGQGALRRIFEGLGSVPAIVTVPGGRFGWLHRATTCLRTPFTRAEFMAAVESQIGPWGARFPVA